MRKTKLVISYSGGAVWLWRGGGVYEAGLAIAQALTEQDLSNTEWQRDLSVSYDKIGDVERQAGNLGAARGGL